MEGKRAFITGITGQDGSYLTEFLLDKGYEVHGIMRRNSLFTTSRIDHVFEHKNLHLHHGDLTDSSNLHFLLSDIKPTEVYNLGAQSHVAVSFEIPEYTTAVDALGALKLLEAIRSKSPDSKFYQASTSELFGGLSNSDIQNELTKFYPKSPYACSKLYAYWLTVNYRESYNLFACNGILFNHESPRRGDTFVTKKITNSVVNIINNKQDYLELGNLDSKRDWGYAKEYVESMWLMLQQKQPDDYTIATGQSYSIRQFVELAFENVGINITWHGNGLEEVGINSETSKVIIRINEKYFRPSEVEFLRGDFTKAKNILGWEPKVKLRELIDIMIKDEMNRQHSSK